MDWVKAKNILIVAFIITNLILGYYTLKDMKANRYSDTISEEKINDIKKIFEEKNIIIKADIPKKTFRVPEITVKYESYDKEEIEDKFLGENESDNKETVKLTSNNKLIIYKKSLNDNNTKSSEEEAKEIAYDFIKEHGYENDEIELWDIKKENNEYEILYKQRYENIILDNGYMKITVKNDQVVYFERRWLQATNVKSIEKGIIPTTKALLLVIDKLETMKDTKDSKVVITDINLVHSLDIHELDGIFEEKWYVGDEKKGLLYWRIILQDGEYIDIEAYE
ncbi:two-component system regulatory protein YycI [Maledivibacter halophilus]|uniref:Two-component signal transduction system YycFG, regulatory protein YycI n=1 Tax=Maledivibacter halophilus TaxID=36842 RepID=A0A1T5MJQ7_9FIRM|nr:two-component system regulatory protein YycI [Maledivibacter halophilus]SKC88446.1 Two-component signal transduction system YycFG, regulatory protein YycI [Maledivibacter halophilus]